ncbi:hypothetical protein [Oceanobacillus salinisoli]|uniref:hypothetical protein n=1 Tax=Oceanobacillus salinisoli TaxID=2678611 RepID=UPI0012E2DC14|nr:hypothetical protein [Oceanobacillus salinisoli]
MNTTGYNRDFIAQDQEGEIFLNHVVGVIEKQILEWNENDKVEGPKTEGYTTSVQGNMQISKISISSSLIESLQLKLQSPYTLDQYIWIELKENGVEVRDANGNYLDYVFM